MICPSCGTGELSLHEITMEKKVFHLNEEGKKEQQVDIEKTSITLCDCDYCHVKMPIDHNDDRILIQDELQAEEILDELGFILP